MISFFSFFGGAKILMDSCSGTLNNASDILSGGTLSIDHVEFIIPRNLLVNTPSLTAVAWSEMFTEEGVLNLPLWPEISWETQVKNATRPS